MSYDVFMHDMKPNYDLILNLLEIVSIIRDK